jgi:glycosyltransferase involved in cell wall biosynthesis
MHEVPESVNQRRRFWFVEPSKVGTQHITLIDGYLRALALSTDIQKDFEVVLCCHPSLHAELSDEVRCGVKYESILVIDPEARRFVPKILLEVWVVFQAMRRARPGDIVFISCVLSTALWMIEGLNRLVRRRNVYVVLHGEVEGLYDPSLRGFKNYGYWSLRWMRLRRPSSLLNLVVIDNFIRERLLADFPQLIKPERIFSIHHPVTPLKFEQRYCSTRPKICFIGYRTKFKGFHEFESLARAVPYLDFVAIGGGKLERVPSGETQPLAESGGYLGAVADCSVAIFPYLGGYTASLSAAALDALSAGVHIIATDRACFVGLAETFGPETVTICPDIRQASALLSDHNWVERQRELQSVRLARLKTSRYGGDGVREGFERLVSAAMNRASSSTLTFD